MIVPFPSRPADDRPSVAVWAMTIVVVLAAAPAAAQKSLVTSREWTDATGQFTVKASLLAIDGDVLTLRQEDGSEVEIEIGQLSRIDRLVALRARRRLALPRGGDTRDPVAFDDSVRATNHTDFPPTPAPAIEADPCFFPTRPDAGKGAIPQADSFDRVSRVLPAAGGQVLVVVENSTPGRPRATRLEWMAPAKGTILASHELPSTDIVLDYHPVLERLLTVTREKSTADGAARQVLTLWDVAATRKAAVPIVSWRAPCGDKQPTARQPWGRIVDDALVLHRSSREEITCWDIDAKAARYRLAQYAGHSPVPALSGGRRLIALPDTKRVQVCDTSSGRILASLAVGAVWGVAFDEAGRRLAVLQGGDVQVHDLADPSSPVPMFRAHGCRANATAIDWAGEDLLLVQSAQGLGAVLWSVTHGLPVWRYQWQALQSGDTADDLAERVGDGMLLYAATGQGDDEGEAEPPPAGGTLATMVSVAIPEPTVAKVLESLADGLPALVERGTVVATKVPPGPEHDRFVAAVGKTFDRNGWVYDATSPAVVEALKVLNGTVSYTDAAGRERQLKQVQPATLRMAMLVHGITMAEANLSTDIPDRLVLAAGETEADLAARLPPPDAVWLERLRLPAVFVDVTEADGQGTTVCGPRGLVSRPRPRDAAAEATAR